MRKLKEDVIILDSGCYGVVVKIILSIRHNIKYLIRYTTDSGTTHDMWCEDNELL